MTQAISGGFHLRKLSISADTQITQLFNNYAEQSWSMLLDSADTQHINARFDLFVANPIATLMMKDGICEVTKPDGSKQQSEQDPLLVLQSMLDLYLPKTLKDSHLDKIELPFKAGAMGYFGYDLGRQFETLTNHAENTYSSADMAVGIYTWSVIKDNLNGTFYLFSLAGFDSPNASQIEILANSPTTKIEHPAFKLCSGWQSNMTQAQYLQKFAAIQYYLNAGDCYQVNLAQRFATTFTGSEWQAYLALRKSNQAPFSAYLKLENTSILSISPERFLSVKDRQVETKPIKGTRPRSTDKQQDSLQIRDLLDSAKDRAENLMIVDLLRNDLSKSCLNNSIHVPELFKIETFEAVHHLVSTVIGKLKADLSSLDLLRGAFPGGSITGAPKIRAMQIIDELEPQRRNIYCGSIGYISFDGNMDTSICIRTLLCENNQIFCWAGGGIVIDSNGLDEYQESHDKVSKILPVLEQLGNKQ